VISALWAAYGDAVGFISEGVDAKGLRRRLRGGRLRPVEWKRKIGRNGPDMLLPAGCYSDDTQLRLATSRAIRADGTFDADLFGQVELPIFLSYALGAGLGTTTSARRLLNGTKWYDLVRGTNASKYVKGGGNGGAMRIQPLVWAAPKNSENWREAVVANVLATHGHPVALAGALFHAEVLRATVGRAGAISINEASDAVTAVRRAPGIIAEHPKLGPPWLFGWERETGRPFDVAYRAANDELAAGLADLDGSLRREDRGSAYHNLLATLGALSDSERGSGTKTALAAYAATLLFADMAPDELLQTIAAELGSDTDSIATMAGAILGLYTRETPDVVLDRTYIIKEAERLERLTSGDSEPYEFAYRGESDAPIPKNGRVLAKREGVTYIAGLGRAQALTEAAREGSNGELYRWYRLEFGQTMLIHVPPAKGGDAALGADRSFSAKPSLFDRETDQPSDERGVSQRARSAPADAVPPKGVATVFSADPRELAVSLTRKGFETEQLGRFFLDQARYGGNEAWIGAVFYELARLYRESLQNAAKIAVAREQPSKSQRVANPTLNAQLTATNGDGSASVEGIVGNFGRGAATDVTLRLSGNGLSADLTCGELQVQQSEVIGTIVHRAIDESTVALVTYRALDGAQFRQEGQFERAPGHEGTYLLKGLGVARAVKI